MRGRKFLFDNSFDEEAQNRLKSEAEARAAREAEVMAGTPPTFTVEELEAAKRRLSTGPARRHDRRLERH